MEPEIILDIVLIREASTRSLGVCGNTEQRPPKTIHDRSVGGFVKQLWDRGWTFCRPYGTRFRFGGLTQDLRPFGSA